MPGAARLYPETDIAPIQISNERLSKIKLPELITDKIKNFEKKYIINESLARELINSKHFENYVKKFKNIEPKIIANMIITIPKDIKTRLSLDISKITDEHIEVILEHLDKNKITKEAVPELFVDICKGKEIDIGRFATISEDYLEEEIINLIKEKPGLNASAYMGLIMAKHRGKIDGKKVMEILKKCL